MTGDAAMRGLVAGLVGTAAMTAAEKLEQMVTGRPNSYVPAHTLERLLRLPTRPDEERPGLNWAMHWGQGILLGAVRGLMAERGLRGPVGSFLHMNLRLLNDQTLENATGVGAPGWISVGEAARRLGEYPAWAYYMIRRGRLLIERDPEIGLYLVPDNKAMLARMKELLRGKRVSLAVEPRSS